MTIQLCRHIDGIRRDNDLLREAYRRELEVNRQRNASVNAAFRGLLNHISMATPCGLNLSKLDSALDGEAL